MIKVFFIFKVICLFTAIIITFANQNPIYAVLHLVTFFVTGSFLLIFLGLDFLPYVFIIVYAGAVAVLFLFIVIILKIKLGSTQINYRNVLIIFLSSLFLSSLTYSLTYLNQDIYSGKSIKVRQHNVYDYPIYFSDSNLLLYFRAPWAQVGKGFLKNYKEKDGQRYITSTFIAPNEKGVLVHNTVEIKLAEDIALVTVYSPKRPVLLPYPYRGSKTALILDENFNAYDSQSSLTNLGKILYTEYNIHFIVCGIILLVAIIGAISLTREKNANASLKQKIFIQTTRSSIIGKYSL